MSKSILVFVLFFSSAVFAANPKHMITLGNNYFGFSGSGVAIDPESSSVFKTVDSSNGELNINYAYSITNQLQLGVLLQSESRTNESKLKTGEKDKEEENFGKTSFFVQYNFSEDLFNSFYLGLMLGSGTTKLKRTNEADPSENYDTKYNQSSVSFHFGKRFSLDSWLGIKNLVYSPSIAIGSVKFDKDFKDAGLKKGTGVEVNFIKFDVLF